jgi:hypothetical protein
MSTTALLLINFSNALSAVGYGARNMNILRIFVIISNVLYIIWGDDTLTDGNLISNTTWCGLYIAINFVQLCISYYFHRYPRDKKPEENIQVVKKRRSPGDRV